MYFYYFMLRRYQRNYEQIKCIAVFLCFFLPYTVAISWLNQQYPLAAQVLLLAGGWCTWTFLEYLLHRFHMHGKKTKRTRMSESHQHHHAHPTEIKVRPVQRLYLFGLLVLVIGVAWWLQGWFTFLAGLYTGIVGYFSLHWLLHQKWAAYVFRRLFRYHIYHHCKFPNTCFGISVPWWDDLFQTVPPKEAVISDRILRFYLNGPHHQPNPAPEQRDRG